MTPAAGFSAEKPVATQRSARQRVTDFHAPLFAETHRSVLPHARNSALPHFAEVCLNQPECGITYLRAPAGQSARTCDCTCARISV